MFSRLLRIIKRIVIVVLVLASVATVLIAATPQGRTGVRAALLVAQVVPDFPFKPQTWFTADPTRTEIGYPLADGRGVADLYEPAGDGRHAAVLLFLGVNPAGRDDERVVNLATGLAGAGMVVMIPWSDTMTQKRIAVEEVDNIVRAFEHLRRLERVDPERAGMGGFCVGASIAAPAAQDPRIRDQVKFVNFFGGYYDALDLMRAIASESRFYDEDIEPWDPDKLAREVFTNHLIESVPDMAERELLTRRFVDREEGVTIEPEGMSPTARTVYELLSGPDPAETERLLRSLPAEFLASMQAVSPSVNIDKLRARVLIMHDREDALVPSEESRRLADALEDGGNVYHTEFSFFQHVDPTQSVNPVTFGKEAYKLFVHLYNILRIAD